MTGLEVLAGAAVMYLVRRAGRKPGTAVDQVVDQVLDAGMDELTDLVGEVLGADDDLAALQQEAGEGGVDKFTQQITETKIARAADRDADFADRLQSLVDRLEERDRQLGGQSTTASVRQNAKASGHGRVYQAGRDQTINEK